MVVAGKSLRQALRESGETFLSVAEQCDVPYSTFYKWGKNESMPVRDSPGIERVLAWGAKYGLTFNAWVADFYGLLDADSAA